METSELKRLLDGTGMKLCLPSYVGGNRIREFTRHVLTLDSEDCANKAYRYLFTCRVEVGDFVERITTGPGLEHGIRVDEPPMIVVSTDEEAGTFCVSSATEPVRQLRMIDMGITWRRG